MILIPAVFNSPKWASPGRTAVWQMPDRKPAQTGYQHQAKEFYPLNEPLKKTLMENQRSICDNCKNYFFTDEQHVTHGFVRLETCKKEHFNKLIKKLRTEEVLVCKDFEAIERP